MADQYGFQSGMEYLNAAPAPYVPPPPVAPQRPAPTAVATQAPTPQGKGLIPSLVEEKETLLGRKLDDNDLEGIKTYARDGHLMPTLAQQGLNEWEAKAQAAAFDQDFEKFKEHYLSIPGAAPTATEGSSGIGGAVVQAPAAVVAGTVGMLGGIASMADYGLRYAKGLALGTKDLVTGEKKWGEIDAPSELLEAYAPKATGLGQLSRGIDSVAQDIRNKYYTKHTQDANAEVAQAVANNDYKELGRVLISKPDVAATFALEMIGGIGSAGQLTKIPKYAKLVSTLAAAGKTERYAARAAQVLPSAIGYAGQQAQQFEDTIRGTDIDTLRQNPQMAAMYEAATAAGYSPAEAAEKTKDHVVATGLDDVLTTSLLANAALPAIGNLGVAERFFASGGTRVASKAAGTSVAKGVASGFAREAGEESLASALEQVGTNIGSRQDIGTNVGTQAVLGGTIGGLVGAPIGGMEVRSGNKLKRKAAANVPDTTDTTVPPTAGQPTPPAAVAATMGQPGTFSPTPATDFEKIAAKVTSTYQEDVTLKRQATAAAKKVDNVTDLVDTAHTVAMATAEKAGTKWDTLSLDQQVDLVESVAILLNNARKVAKFDNLAEEIVKRKQTPAPAPVASPVAPQAAPAPAATPPAESTPEEVRAAIAEVGGQATYADLPHGPEERALSIYNQVTKANGYERGVRDTGWKTDPLLPQMQAAIESGAIKNEEEAVKLYEKLRATPAGTNGSNGVTVGPGGTGTTAVESQADTEGRQKTVLDQQLITEYGIDPALLAKLNLEQTKNFHASTIAQAEAAKAAAAVPAKAEAKPKPLTAAATKEQRRNLFLQDYLRAIMNEGQSTGPREETMRSDASFNTARAAFKAGKINTPAQLDAFLKAASEAPSTPQPTSENVLLGVALELKGAKKSVTDVKKLARTLIDKAVELGLKAEDAKRMTFAQAKTAIKQLEEAVPKTPAVKTKPLAKKAKKEEAPAPKTQAPAQEKAAGAAESKNETQNPQPDALAKKYPGEKNPKLRELYDRIDRAQLSLTYAFGGGQPSNAGAKRARQITDRVKEELSSEAKWKKATTATIAENVNMEPYFAEYAKRMEAYVKNAADENSPLGREIKLLADVEQARQIASTNKALTKTAKDSINEALDAIESKMETMTAFEQQRISRELAKLNGADLLTTVETLDSILEAQKNKNQPNPNEPDDIETRLSGILADTPILKDIEGDIVLAIVNKDISELSNLVRGLRDAGDINTEQMKAIQALVKIKAPVQVKLEPIEVEDIGSLDSLESRLSITHILDRVSQNPDANLVEMMPKLKSLIADYSAGAISENQLMAEIDTIAPAPKISAKGIDWFEQRLAEALRNKELPAKTVELMRFFIRQNPNMVSDATLSVRKLNANKEKGMPLQRGLYEVAERIISLATDAGRAENAHTGVHEVLHHTERMMPPKVREGIRRAYTRDLTKQLKASHSEDVKTYLTQALAMAQTGNYSEAASAELSKLFQKATETGEGFAMPLLYQYHSPSEYWAVNGPIIIQSRMEAQAGGWVAQAKQWLREFLETLKRVVGLSNKSEIIAGLNSVLKGDGKFVADKLIAGEATNVSSLDAPTKANLKEKLAETQAGARRTWEALAQKMYSFEQEENRIVKEDGKITPENSITDGIVRFNGIKNDILSLDESEVSAGVYNWFTQNWQTFGETREKAVRNINKFLHNTHVLERNHVLWLQNGKLGAGKAFEREVLLTKLSEGTITPQQARKDLAQMMASHATETEAQYAAKKLADYDGMLNELVKLKKQGIHKGSMGELNTLLQNVRDRTTARNVQSGFISEDDPWTKFYDFKWYVPLKGTFDAEANSQIADLDLEGAQGRQALARINKQIESMTGRKSIADSPLEQLLVDMSLAGRRTAEQDFTGSALKLILDNRKLFKDVTIDVFEGRPKDGYKHVSGKKKKSKVTKKDKEFYRKLPAPGDGFIFHDGETHYVVKLPKESLLLRGILQMGNEANLNFLDKASGKVTNVLSKLYTTANPLWQTFVALPRDLTYMPLMMAMRQSSGPVEGTKMVAKYAANLLSNAFDPANIPATAAILSDNRGKLVQYARDNPESSVAWLRRYESAGGSTNFVAGFNTATLGNKLTGKYNNEEGIWVVTKPWRMFEKFTNNYASLLENIARVAAFRTLVESGMSDREAAAKVKDYLNYDQSGNYSRKINSYIPFFKVGMTGADAMRKTFMDKKGNFDTKKFAAWATYFLILGASKYLLDKELLGKDDDGEDNIKKIKLDTMTQKSLIKVGDKTWGFNYGLGLPQILLAPGVIMGAVLSGNATPEEGARAYYEMIARNAPVRPSGLPKEWGWQDLAVAWTTGSLVPAGLNPIVATSANRDAFGRDIHTRYGDDKKFKSDQGKSSTPDEWSELSSALRENVGIDMYPEDLRYLVKNYGGQLVSKFLQVTIDADAEQDAGAGNIDIAGRATGAQVIDSDFYLRSETYDTLNKLSIAQKRKSAIEKAAARSGTDEDAAVRQWLAATPGAADQIAAHKALDKAIDTYNKSIKTIRADKLRGQTWKDTQRKLADSKLRQAYEAAKKEAPED